MNTFVEDWTDGIAQPEQIDDYVDRWHGSNSTLPLATYLGLRFDQYARWLKDPKQLLLILHEASHERNKGR